MNFRKVALPLVCALVGAAIGYMFSRHSDFSGPARLAHGDTNDRFAKVALLRKQEGHVQQAELLQEIALDRMRDDPTRIPEVWQVLQSNIAVASQGAFAEVIRLGTFDRSVRASLLHCSSLAEFEMGWRVHTAIETLLHKKRSELQSDVAAELQTLRSQCDESPFGKSISSFVAAMVSTAPDQTSLGARLTAALPPPATGLGGDVLRSPLKDLIRSLLAQAASEYASVKEAVSEQRKRDEANEELVPASEAEGGRFQRLLERLAALQDSLETADFDRWIWFTDGDALSTQLEDLRHSISQLGQSAFELQRGRYNLWALTQIHAAEESLDWPQRLGQVDVHLLHPTVSALYSMVYNRRIEAAPDRHKRGYSVRLLLNQAKIRQEQF